MIKKTLLYTSKSKLECASSCNVVTLYYVYTPWAVKRSQLIFVCNFVKNEWILMQFSLLDVKMKLSDICEGMNFTHLT